MIGIHKWRFPTLAGWGSRFRLWGGAVAAALSTGVQLQVAKNRDRDVACRRGLRTHRKA